MLDPRARNPVELLTELVEQLGELYSSETASIAELHRELDAVRGDVSALSNRIESVFRALDAWTESLV